MALNRVERRDEGLTTWSASHASTLASAPLSGNNVNIVKGQKYRDKESGRIVTALAPDAPDPMGIVNVWRVKYENDVVQGISTHYLEPIDLETPGNSPARS